MSDPDAMPDPIDKAYVEAEAVLSDETARAARRARVLAAVARQGATDADAPAARPRLWRRGGWLVAASVSGLVLAITLQLYRPSPYEPLTKSTARAGAPATAGKVTAAAPASAAPASPVPASPAPASLAQASPTQASPAPAAPASAQGSALASKAAPRDETTEAEPLPVVVAPSPAPPPPAPSVAVPAPRAFPSDASAPPPPPQAESASSERAAPVQAANQPQPRNGGADNRTSVTEIVVTSEKRESRRQSVPAAISAFIGRQQDPGARLRAAAAAGRATDVEGLLEQGVPVNSTDARGNTALMKSIQADHPAAATVLSEHGASLDQKNHAGQSARDMAKAKGDAELNQAIGLSP